MDEKTFDNNFNSNIGKAFRKLNDKVGEYIGNPSNILFNTMDTPIINYITAYYWEDMTAKQVFDIIVKILYDYDLILYNEEKAWAQPEVARKKSRRKPRLIDKRAAV